MSNLQFFRMREIVVSKYRHLNVPGKGTPDIDFTDEAVVQCDAPVAQILL